MKMPVRIFLIFCFGFIVQTVFAEPAPRTVLSLNGTWRFVTDPAKEGLATGWNEQLPAEAVEVQVPHTWNVMKGYEDYNGLAWYGKSFEVPAEWKDKTVRLRFAAVYRDATIYINGKKAGTHVNSGYTTFYVDVSHLLKYGSVNSLVVSVDNAFSETALPYRDSFDWNNDGGIIREVEIVVAGKPSIRNVHVTPVIDFADTSAKAIVKIRLWEEKVKKAAFDIVIREKASGKIVLDEHVTINKKGDAFIVAFRFPKVKLWHFNDPFLYEAVVNVRDGKSVTDSHVTRLGFRKVKLKGQKLYVNNEPVRLPGIEYMPGSHPHFGSAEPKWVMDSVVAMLKDLNAVITRFHWQVDEYILDRFDEAGILVQCEIPWWQQPGKLSASVMATAKMQLTEMIERDFNHPSVFAWGISNEVFSSDSEQYHILYDFTKQLDTSRLAVVVSNETYKRREKDESLIADLPTWNDYVGTWYGKSSDELPAFLKEIESFLGDRPLLITEAGLCEPRFSGGDLRRVEDMIDHYKEWEKRSYIAGAIYFCLNDYRTHRGEDGEKNYKARIHGITDLFFNKKPSYYMLKQLASPVVIQDVKKLKDKKVAVRLRNKNTLPSYSVKGYRLVWCDEEGNRRELPLPLMKPGDEITIELDRIHAQFGFDIFSPSGYHVTGYPLAWSK